MDGLTILKNSFFNSGISLSSNDKKSKMGKGNFKFSAIVCSKDIVGSFLSFSINDKYVAVILQQSANCF